MYGCMWIAMYLKKESENSVQLQTKRCTKWKNNKKAREDLLQKYTFFVFFPEILINFNKQVSGVGDGWIIISIHGMTLLFN